MENLLVRTKDYFLTRKSLRTKTPLRIVIEKRKKKLTMKKVENRQPKPKVIVKNSKLKEEIKKYSLSKSPLEAKSLKEKEQLIRERVDLCFDSTAPSSQTAD